jgi:glucose-1-phosphate adenylyltransferase
MFDSNWRLYGHEPPNPPHFIGPEATVTHSEVAEGCEIYGDVENSIISFRSKVAPGAQVRYSILMPGVTIEEGAVIEYAIIAEGAKIGRGARVGASPGRASDVDEWGIAAVGGGVEVPPGYILGAKEMM